MQGMRKNAKWKMVLPAALILTLMFRGGRGGCRVRSGGIRNDMGASAADRGNWAGLDYQGGIQLFVCGNFSRFYSVFRNEF